jgi:hypothetical protein
MLERLKNLSAAALGLVIFLGVLAIPVLFFMGALWAAENLLRPLIVAGWLVLAADVLLALASAIRPFRGVTGSLIFLSSYLFGLVTWLLGFILTYAIWGLWAVILGMLFFGGGVVPVALLATMFKGMWDAFFTVLVMALLTYGSRLGGIYIASAGQSEYQV